MEMELQPPLTAAQAIIKANISLSVMQERWVSLNHVGNSFFLILLFVNKKREKP